MAMADSSGWRSWAAVLAGGATAILVNLCIFILTRPHPVFFPRTSLGSILLAGCSGAVLALAYARLVRTNRAIQLIPVGFAFCLALAARWYISRIDLVKHLIPDLWVK
jgi:hypothetical protein